MFKIYKTLKLIYHFIEHAKRPNAVYKGVVDYLRTESDVFDAPV